MTLSANTFYNEEIVIVKPTTDEWKVLRALQVTTDLHGSPTLMEIAMAMTPVSNVATVHRAIQRLVLKGWVRHWPGRARGIKLLYRVPAIEWPEEIIT